MKYRVLLSSLLALILTGANVPMGLAQESTADNTQTRASVKGGMYDKPFITRMGRTSLGGYTEVHFCFEREEGVTEEVTFEPKRFNLFTYTPVTERVRVASELEFEEGGEEIKIELAALEGLLSKLPKSVFTGVVRYGLVDFDTDIDGDSQNRLTLGLNFRPTEDTAFKLDYQYNWFRDRVNLEARSAGLFFSVATYF